LHAGSIPAISTRLVSHIVRHSLVASHSKAWLFRFAHNDGNRVECPELVEGLVYNQLMYFVYMIKNLFGKLYIGVSQNPQARLHDHNHKQGAKFTKHTPTLEIVFLEPHQTLTDARKREIQIKKWRRDKKEMLIDRYVRKLPTKD